MWRLIGNFVRFWVPYGLIQVYRQLWHARRRASHGRVVEFLLPVKELGQIFPGIESLVVQLPVSQLERQRDMVMPLPELLAIAAICRGVRPHRVLEIGTYTGSTTLAMASNAPEDAALFTLDLPPRPDRAPMDGAAAGGLPASVLGSAFHGTLFAGRITQLMGDSATFDFGPYHESIDLVLIDAAHTYEFVRRDTEAAFRVLRPGGVVIWDDYRWEERFPECAGVTRCVNEVARSRPCFQIAGTRLAVHVNLP